MLGSLEDVKTVDKIIAETVAKFGRIDVLVRPLLINIFRTIPEKYNAETRLGFG